MSTFTVTTEPPTGPTTSKRINRPHHNDSYVLDWWARRQDDHISHVRTADTVSYRTVDGYRITVTIDSSETS